MRVRAYLLMHCYYHLPAKTYTYYAQPRMHGPTVGDGPQNGCRARPEPPETVARARGSGERHHIWAQPGLASIVPASAVGVGVPTMAWLQVESSKPGSDQHGQLGVSDPV